MDRFPYVDPALVEALAQLFPDQVPDISDPDRKVWLRVGQVSVVRFLRSKAAEQEEHSLVEALTSQGSR